MVDQTDSIKVALFGAAGRMGCEIATVLNASPDMQLVAAVDRAESKAIGCDMGEVAGGPKTGVILSSDQTAAAKAADVVIDFSVSAAFPAALETCRATGTAFVCGTTGLEPSHQKAIDAAAKEIPVLYAANMSLGVTILDRLVGEATRMLGDDYDVEIVEMHHKHKKDAPSGTALRLGETVAEARGTTLEQSGAFGRHGEGVREPGSIGFAALRGGDVAGDHTVVFAADGGRLELTFKASSRRIFADGAVRAARWLNGQTAGRYSIHDLLDAS